MQMVDVKPKFQRYADSNEVEDETKIAILRDKESSGENTLKSRNKRYCIQEENEWNAGEFVGNHEEILKLRETSSTWETRETRLLKITKGHGFSCGRTEVKFLN